MVGAVDPIVIRARNLRKRYDGRVAVDGIDFDVPRGRCFGFLGPNGAGKTTTLRMLLGLTPASGGTLSVLDLPIPERAREVRARVGVVPQADNLDPDFTVEENLRIAERKKGDLERRADFIFGLFPDLKRLYRLPGNHLSGGQQQMLAIARALVADNRLLLIDEPSEGLAPILIEQVMEAIQELSASTTILLVEQNFLMASQLGDYYYIIDEGRTVHNGEMATLVADAGLVQQYLGASVRVRG